MKKKLIKTIQNVHTDPSFTLYKIIAFLQEVDLKMANIIMKVAQGKKSLEKEVLHTVYDLL
jgi:hypothetical protein